MLMKTFQSGIWHIHEPSKKIDVPHVETGFSPI